MEVAVSIVGLLETSVGIISRLRNAYSRQRELPSLLEQHHGEIEDTKKIIEGIQDEESLHTAAVISQMVKLESLSRRLRTHLQRLDPGEKSKPHQIVHQLISGSKDERELNSIVNEMINAKRNLSMDIQLATVGLSIDIQQNIVANKAEIVGLDRTLRDLLGDGRGLKIATLIENQSVREDGNIDLDTDTLNQIGVSCSHKGTTRIIVDNISLSLALQINGPTGADQWKDISHLEIRDNKAGVASSQVNYPVSAYGFAFLLFDHSIKCILLFVLIYLPFRFLFTKG